MSIKLFEKSWYHKLVKVVYGSTFYRLQANEINNLKLKNILIIGAGSGEIIKYLNPNVNYTLVEKSNIFHQLCLKQVVYTQSKNINLINGDFFEIKLKQNFDGVIFPFFLDLLNESEIKKTLQKTEFLLEKTGILLTLDFKSPSNFMESFHLKFLYFIFRLTDNIKAKNLPSLNLVNFKIMQEKDYKIGLFYKLQSRKYTIITNKV